tara:strand:- start:5806 stop:6306 length:501 start_codon:yes stop_codon:yes gene_type:complete
MATKQWHTCPLTGRKVTQFEHKWGIKAEYLALHEMVSVDAIHMRVRNFGSPFMRKPKPSLSEVMYNKTLRELGKELGAHPTTIDQRIRLRGSAYLDSLYQHMLGTKKEGVIDWEYEKKALKPQGWLHKKHPAYTMWRVIVVRHILNGMTLEQAVEKMLLEIDTCKS